MRSNSLTVNDGRFRAKVESVASAVEATGATGQAFRLGLAREDHSPSHDDVERES